MLNFKANLVMTFLSNIEKDNQKKSRKKYWFGWNPGPLACEASVIATTLPNLVLHNH